ncbi:hypothetical protein CVT25_010886 [Psilocybe cyanescens]|uniref:Uncharacterized protein n=1 Tax=Psilocybe cyanescens TaxID=93625 RepID=A0A409WFP1_PSICY|nr:hypothetical protein CVT25_010886 [Psilocybe cyanescens]
MHSQGLPLSLSGRLSPAISSGFESGLGLGLQESGRLNSFNSDASSGDHVRITMKTRVAVRDKNPHRFQVVPLRDVTKDVLSQAELSSRLMVPSTPASYLCTSSRKIVSYSQPRLIHSSLSAQSLWNKSGKENRHSEAGGTELNARTLGSLDSKASLSSITFSRVEGNATLAERDLNREETKPASIPHLPSNWTTQSKPAVLSNLPSKDSFNNSVNFAPITYATSQSLHIQKRSRNEALNFGSLSHFPLDLKVEHTPVERISRNETREPKNLDSAKPRSKKRHAMYTPPLFLPYFEKRASSELENPDKDERQVLHEAINDKKARQDATSDMVQLDNDRTICLEFQDFDACLDDQDIPRRILQDPFDICSSGSIDFLPIDSPLHYSSPKSGNLSSRLRLSLNCQKAPRTLCSDRLSGAVVYPKMVLELFVELDKAIESWSTKNM